MSTQTSIHFRNANDPEFLQAIKGPIEDYLNWIKENGNYNDRPGARLEVDEDKIVHETDDEYGGWVIAVADLPKDCTHIVITRG